MKISLKKIIFIVVLLCSQILAQDSLNFLNDYQLDEIIVSSDKLDTKLSDASSRIEIIDSKRIESVNGNRLADILKSSSSVFIKSYGLSPSLQTISLNGLGAEHTLIILDNVRLNSFQNSLVDLSLISKDNIERIEIINNGVSSIYGSDALGGVVNIILKKRENLIEENILKLNASISLGSFNTKEYSFGLYQQFKKFSSRIFYSKETSNGDYDYYFKNGSIKTLKSRQNSSYSIYDYGLSAQYIIDKNNILKILSTYSDQDKHIPGIETGTTPPPTKQYDKNWNNILTIENILWEDFYLNTNFNFQNNFMNYSIQPILNSSYNNFVYSTSSELKIKKNNYGFTTGYNFYHALLKSKELINGVKRNQHAIFVSSVFNLSNWLKLFPSSRYDFISDINEGTYTYKLGINFKPFKQDNFSIKTNFGKNFRAPSFNDLYWKNSGNENLKPEKSFNTEMGFYYSFYEFFKTQIDFSYTFISAINKIVWIPQPSGLWSPQNIAESISKNLSFNIKLSKTILNDLEFNFDAGLQIVNSKKTSENYKNDPTKNKYIPFIPLKSTNINFGVQQKIFEINIFYSLIGKRYSDFVNTKTMKSFDLIDANISYKLLLFNVNIKLRFEVNNMFNKDYEIISGYPMPLRYFNLTLFIDY